MFGVVFVDKQMSHIFPSDTLKLLFHLVFTVAGFLIESCLSERGLPAFCRI